MTAQLSNYERDALTSAACTLRALKVRCTKCEIESIELVLKRALATSDTALPCTAPRVPPASAKMLDHEPIADYEDMAGQMRVLFDHMVDGAWFTLQQLADDLDQREGTLSANMRSFRKARFGGHTVNRRRVPCGQGGWWEYQLITEAR